MADILVIVRGISATDNGDDVQYDCVFRTSGMGSAVSYLPFTATAPIDALASTISANIKAAAIAAASAAGYVVDVLDKKTLIGNAVAL